MMKTEDWVGAEEKENEQRAGKQHERDLLLRQHWTVRDVWWRNIAEFNKLDTAADSQMRTMGFNST